MPLGGGAVPAAATPAAAGASPGATSAAVPAPPIHEEEPEGNATAEACKPAGNEHFKAGRYDEAAAHYTEAIGHDPTNAALFSNRAAAHTKMELYDRAVGMRTWRWPSIPCLDKCPGDGALLKGKRAARARVSAYNAVQGPGAAQAAAAANEVPAVRVAPTAAAAAQSSSPRHSGTPMGVARSWASTGGPGPGLDSIPSTASVGVDSGNVRPPPVTGNALPAEGGGGGAAGGYGAAGVTGPASGASAGAGQTGANGGGGGGRGAAGSAAGADAAGAGGAAAGTAAAGAGGGDNTKGDTPAPAGAFPGSPEEEVARIQAAANYYVVLHASPEASPTLLKKNYYTLARLLHPDKYSVPGADDAMKEVSHAYDTLSNSLKRTLYDKYMTERKPPPGASGDGDASAEQTYAEWEARQEPVQLPGWLVWLLSVWGVNWVVTGVVLALLLPLVILVFLVSLILYLLCLPYRLVLQCCFPEKFAQMRADAERHEARREQMEQDVRYAHV
ncbi:hypothetical protein I4F81_009346 [Pyropia yezoensis]|uniref:Uncharacterized protein n=1 Tax=Pyropia yezoensis TaxID=2788 RepID=A0ACC3C9L2_PYRYE|nr:hypothetical protein I4F81_009346 [Neopyropia yezoensis]